MSAEKRSAPEGELVETEEVKKPRLDDGGDSPGAPDSDSEHESEEEQQQLQDPGKKAYQEMKLVLKQLSSLADRSEKSQDLVERVESLLNQLATLVTSKCSNGETPNPVKLLQMQLKHSLFNSEAIRDEDNIKTFLSGLEDCSAVKSDRSDTIYVFLANYATELWYQWDTEQQQWQWTPEADGSLWMPCATTVVSDGGWKGEVPAPENVEIINYLNAIRPLPSDEQYLPAFCDVLKLLRQLSELGARGAGVMQAVRRIAGAVLECEEVGEREEAKGVREVREKLRVLMEETGRKEEEGREEVTQEGEGEKGEGEGGDQAQNGGKEGAVEGGTEEEEDKNEA